MATFQQLKQNIGHAWEYLAEGWDGLTRNAITHLTANAHKDPANRNTDWGLMASEVFDDDRVIVRGEKRIQKAATMLRNALMAQ